MDLAGAARYNPNLYDELEKYATEEPERVKIWLLGQILVKSMMRLPETDFATVLHLIPEKMQEEQPIASLVALMQHLEGARFSTFWAAADNCRDTLSKVPGFAEAIREYILKQVNSTCQQIRQSVLGEFLNLDSASLDQLVAQKVKTDGWQYGPKGTGTIILPTTNLNVLNEPQSATSAFRFEQLAPLLKTC